MADSSSVKRARINIYLVQDLKDYVDGQAKAFGLSTSAYMTMLIQQHRLQTDALANMSNVNEVMVKLEQFKLEQSRE